MKGLLFINLIMLSVIMNGCTAKKSVAAAYKEKMAKGESGDAAPAEGDDSEAGGETGEGGEGEDSGDTGDSEAGEGEEGAAEGDKTAGLAFIKKNCDTCHSAITTVKFDKTAVDKLDGIFSESDETDDSKTKNLKLSHAGAKEEFEANRADVEAALNSK